MWNVAATLLSALTLALFNVVLADSPPPDSSPALFAGEWFGAGDLGAFCYLNLQPDGTGYVLIDEGSGDGSAARMRWRNRRQTLEISSTEPVPAASRMRVIPLAQFLIGAEFNRSLRLTWREGSDGCRLQKAEAMASRLDQARSTVRTLSQQVPSK